MNMSPPSTPSNTSSTNTHIQMMLYNKKYNDEHFVPIIRMVRRSNTLESSSSGAASWSSNKKKKKEEPRSSKAKLTPHQPHHTRSDRNHQQSIQRRDTRDTNKSSKSKLVVNLVGANPRATILQESRQEPRQERRRIHGPTTKNNHDNNLPTMRHDGGNRRSSMPTATTMKGTTSNTTKARTSRDIIGNRRRASDFRDDGRKLMPKPTMAKVTKSKAKVVHSNDATADDSNIYITTKTTDPPGWKPSGSKVVKKTMTNYHYYDKINKIDVSNTTKSSKEKEKNQRNGMIHQEHNHHRGRHQESAAASSKVKTTNQPPRTNNYSVDEIEDVTTYNSVHNRVEDLDEVVPVIVNNTTCIEELDEDPLSSSSSDNREFNLLDALVQIVKKKQLNEQRQQVLVTNTATKTTAATTTTIATTPAMNKTVNTSAGSKGSTIKNKGEDAKQEKDKAKGVDNVNKMENRKKKINCIENNVNVDHHSSIKTADTMASADSYAFYC